MFEKILVATDGSDLGRRSLDVALRMAKQYRSSLTVIHVVESQLVRPYLGHIEKSVISGELLPPLTTLPTGAQHEAVSRAMKVMEEAKDICNEEGVRAKLILRDGDPTAEILREASDNYGLLVLGYRGEHPSQIGLGTVGERVVKNAPCSTLVIR